MTAHDAFQVMLRGQIGQLLRSAGFARSAATWRLQSARGDVAIVNLQKSRWNSGDEVNFYVNLAILPAAWWEYLSEQGLDKVPATPKEYHGLLRRRLDPPSDQPSLRAGWLVRDASTAAVCGRVLCEQLDRVVVPDLKALLDRDRLVALIGTGAAGWWMIPPADLAIGYVIADQGTSQRLDDILDAVASASHEPRFLAQSEWLRIRATVPRKPSH